MKPDKWTIRELAGILVNRIRRKINRILSGYRSRLGFWYCGHCRKYHSPLVKKTDPSEGLCDPWCSLGSDDDYPDDY